MKQKVDNGKYMLLRGLGRYNIVLYQVNYVAKSLFYDIVYYLLHYVSVEISTLMGRYPF